MAMITAIPERDYRLVSMDSSSSLKDFSSDRRKYYKKHILKEKVKEKPDKAANMGRIVETLLMEPERFDELFFMSSLVKVPGGMLGDFIWHLSELVGGLDKGEDYVVGEEEFLELAKNAYKKAGFKIKFETVFKKLDDPDNEIYYTECLRVNALNMTMVTPQDITNAEQIVAELKSNSITSTIVNLESGSDYTVYNQIKITGFDINGIPLKSMLDKMIVNHKKKQITIYDLKCTWSVENFYREYYLYRKAFIQAYVYYRAVLALTAPGKEFEGYTVLPTKFLVCDSINYYSPLIYELTHDDLKDARLGFTYNNRFYEGVDKIIVNRQWAVKEDIWGISRENFLKKGVLNIKD